MIGRRILVVDDEDGLRTTLAANLELDGFEVVEAESGAAALGRAAERDFDVVLSDIRMPGMSGIDLFRQLRVLRPGLPVLLMTAFALESMIRDALREGAYMVIPKPFDLERLAETLRRAVDRPLVCVVDAPDGTTADALTEMGVAARPVRDQAAAIELVEGGQVGVCVVDLALPAVDGPELISRLYAIDPELVFIVLSGRDVDHLMRKVAVHASSILSKPVAAHDLVEAIARARLRLGGAKR